MRSKLALNLTTNYSINFSFPKISKKKIIFIIIHYTGMKNDLEAIRKLCDYRSNVSSHYLIKNNGEILNLVPDLYVAWHAGKSSWKRYKLLNKFSIGVEISNPGHEHGYKKFNSSQISSLIKLLKYLQKDLVINIASFQEMNLDVINNYIKYLESNEKSFFLYHCNREEKVLPDGSITKIKDFKFKKPKKVIVDEICPWHKNFITKSYPFIVPFDGITRHQLYELKI